MLYVKRHVLDFAGQIPLSDYAMKAALERLTASTDSVTFVSPHLSATLELEDTKKLLKRMFRQPGVEHVVLPVLFGKNPWRGLFVSHRTRELVYYDPKDADGVAKSYGLALENVLPLLPGTTKYRLRRYVAGAGTQSDNYNCGVFVLLATEAHVFGRATGRINKHTLQFLRYRYHCMCLSDAPVSPSPSVVFV